MSTNVKSKVIPLRMSENLGALATMCSQEQHSDKATVLRQWLYQGAERYALQLVSEGRISAGRAAELLDQTIYDIYYLAQKYGVELGATEEQHQKSMELVERLTRGKEG